MTPDNYIAILGIALPLTAKVAVDLAAYLNTRKHTALAAIVGMAGRQAATIARTLAESPSGVTAKQIESKLITDSTAAIMTRMGESASTVGADSAKIAGIVQGELDKLAAGKPPVQ